MKYKRTITAAILRLCLLFMAAALYRIYNYRKQEQANSRLNDDLVDMAVIPTDGNDTPQENLSQRSENEAAPIIVDFDVLCQENQDIVGWLYCADSIINYPVVQGDDNDYYLHHLLDGSENSSGTLFVDFRNAEDFSDWHTIFFGHNMRNDTMFGTLTEYASQEYYDAHPVMYLLTPMQNYKIELVAGYVTSFNSEIYGIKKSIEERNTLLQTALDKSDFNSAADINDDDQLITLSTCSYEYENARYVLIGVLREIA